jgi:phosphotriesterase-related protein
MICRRFVNNSEIKRSQEMNQRELVGKVQTVLGLVDPGSLGITLAHEHIMADLSVWFNEPTEASEKQMAHEPITMDTLWWIKTHIMNHADNVRLDDEELMIKEVLMFRNAGGGTIVDLTNIGLARDPLALARISRATGLNIVMGSGYYIKSSHPPELTDMTEPEITDRITKEVLEGVDGTDIRSGIIGEIGCSDPLDETEKKALRAAAASQQRTGAAINVHPSPKDSLALEILDILKNAGADLTRTIISHVDQWGFSEDTCRKITDAGCFIEFDGFGNEGVFLDRQTGTLVGCANDAALVAKRIGKLISRGYLNNILISGDICLKYLLSTYGGYGYAHIPRDIVPVMQWCGLSQEHINRLLVENPKQALTFVTIKNEEAY